MCIWRTMGIIHRTGDNVPAPTRRRWFYKKAMKEKEVVRLLDTRYIFRYNFFSKTLVKQPRLVQCLHNPFPFLSLPLAFLSAHPISVSL
jgi:hypothetical protein